VSSRANILHQYGTKYSLLITHNIDSAIEEPHLPPALVWWERWGRRILNTGECAAGAGGSQGVEDIVTERYDVVDQIRWCGRLDPHNTIETRFVHGNDPVVTAIGCHTGVRPRPIVGEGRHPRHHDDFVGSLINLLELDSHAVGGHKVRRGNRGAGRCGERYSEDLPIGLHHEDSVAICWFSK